MFPYARSSSDFFVFPVVAHCYDYLSARNLRRRRIRTNRPKAVLQGGTQLLAEVYFDRYYYSDLMM